MGCSCRRIRFPTASLKLQWGVAYFEVDQTLLGAYNCTYRSCQYATWSSDNISMKGIVIIVVNKSIFICPVLGFRTHSDN